MALEKIEEEEELLKELCDNRIAELVEKLVAAASEAGNPGKRRRKANSSSPVQK